MEMNGDVSERVLKAYDDILGMANRSFFSVRRDSNLQKLINYHLNGWDIEEGFGLDVPRFTLWKNGKIIAVFRAKETYFSGVNLKWRLNRYDHEIKIS